jgi:hypothetical protein
MRVTTQDSLLGRRARRESINMHAAGHATANGRPISYQAGRTHHGQVPMRKSIPHWILYHAVALPLVITAGHIGYTGCCRSTGHAGRSKKRAFPAKDIPDLRTLPASRGWRWRARAVVSPRRRRDYRYRMPRHCLAALSGGTVWRHRPAARVNAGGRSCEPGMPKTVASPAYRRTRPGTRQYLLRSVLDSSLTARRRWGNPYDRHGASQHPMGDGMPHHLLPRVKGPA